MNYTTEELIGLVLTIWEEGYTALDTLTEEGVHFNYACAIVDTAYDVLLDIYQNKKIEPAYD